MLHRQLGTGYLNVAALAFLVGVAGSVFAGSYTNSASGNWSLDASWSGGKPAAGGAADAVIVFNSAGVDNSTNNLSGTFAMNRMEFASGTVNLTGNALLFTNNGAIGPLVANASGSPASVRNPITLRSDTTFSTAGSVTLNGAIGGGGGLIKAGSGTLSLATNNTYTGSTTVSEGTLTIVTATTVTSMSSTNFTILDGATMRVPSGAPNAWSTTDKTVFNVQSNGTLTTDVPTIHCGYLYAASGSTVTGFYGCLSLHGTNTGAVVTTTLGSVNFKRIILEPNTATNPTQTLQFDGTGTGLTIGIDSGTPFSWRQGGATGLHTYIMDIADSPSAAVDLSVPFLNLRPVASGIAFVKRGAGVMQISGLDWSSAPVASAPVTCAVSGGTLVLNTSATNTVGVNFSNLAVDSGATLQVGAGGPTGSIYAAVANDGTLVFNRSDAVAYNHAISGTGGVLQKGAGTLTLTGTHTYTGWTTNSAGTLLVNSPGSLAADNEVTVTGGTLGGNGTISGTVELAAGAALAPGGTNTLGTLTLASSSASALTLNGNSLLFDLSNAAGTCDQVPVAGSLVLNGVNTISLSFPNGTPPAGTYTLMTYTSKTGSGSFALNTSYPNTTLNVDNSGVTLTVTGSGITFLKWKGSESGTWDTSTANWMRDGGASVYTDGDAVLFDDTAAGNYSVSGSAVTPASVTFNNSVSGSASNYTVTADIEGSGALFKLGTGKATLSGANTYSGGTTLSGGTLSVGAFASLPATGGLTFNGGTLQVAGTAITSLGSYTVNWGTFNGGLNVASYGHTLNIPDSIGGSGSLSKQGAGNLALSAANTYSGGTVVGGGSLSINNSKALGSGSVSVAENAWLSLAGGITVSNAVTVVGNGDSYGALQSAEGASNTWSGPVTLGANLARIGAQGPDSVLRVTGVIGSGANAYDLQVRARSTGGTLILATNNTWLGNTWHRCGILRLAVNNALPPTAALKLGLGAPQANNVDATLDLAGYNQQIAGLQNAIPIDNGRTVTNSAATLSTLTVNNAAAPYTFDGVIAGNVALVKAGNGVLTLAGTNTTSGGFTVDAGTLIVSATGTLGANSTNITVNAGMLTLSNTVSIADTAALRIADGGGAKVYLGANESVGTLYLGENQKRATTYGAPGSGAAVTDSEHFAGSGILTVLHGNGGTIISFY